MTARKKYEWQQISESKQQANEIYALQKQQVIQLAEQIEKISESFLIRRKITRLGQEEY